MRGVFGWLLASVVLGGIVHIAAMLVVPTLAPQSAFSRFETTLQSNFPRVLPPAEPGRMPFPFASPDVVYTLCRFDVSTAPVRIASPTRYLYWSAGLYEPDGGNFFHINSAQSSSASADIVLLGRGQEADFGEDAVIVRATHPTGLVILRFFMRDRTMAESLVEKAEGASCSAVMPEENEQPPVPLPGTPPQEPVTTGSVR